MRVEIFSSSMATAANRATKNLGGTMKALKSRSALVTLCSVVSCVATAQDQPAEASGQVLQEVVVSAQKREENIQSVPIAVTAFTAAELEARGIGDVQQLSGSAPNVTFDAGTPFSGSTSVLSAYIRGIGQNDFAFNLDPGVGVYIDGVYLARSVGANTDLLDVERIEVLKGPQGTLFGRNTIGGAINIVTRNPSKEFAFKGDITAGSFNRMDVRGSFDTPFTDGLRANISFSSKKRDGYQRRIPYVATGDQGVADCVGLTNCAFTTDPANSFEGTGYQTSEREGGQNEWNVRGKLLWDASERARFILAADYTNVDQSAMANSVLQTVVTGPTAAFGAFYNLCINTPGSVLNTIGFGLVCGPRGTVGTPLAGVNVDGNPANNRLPYDDRFVTADKDVSYATGNSFSKIKNYGYSLTGEFDLTDDMLIRSITAYRDLDWRSGLDLDGSPLPILEPSFSMVQRAFSEELQLTGKMLEQKLDYVLGAYYFRESGLMNDFVTFPAGLLQIHGPNELATKTWAGFLHVNYRVTDKFGLTLGGRYTKEDKEFEGGQTDLNAFNYKIANCYPPQSAAPAPFPAGLTCQQALGFVVPGQPLRYFPAGVNTQDFSVFTPRIGGEFHFTDAMMLYASFSKGFKSGGWTTRLSNPIDDIGATEFGPEKAKSYEVGLKTELFERRVRLNTAAFFTDYDGIQLNFQEGVSPTIHNAGKAEIYGGEIELQALISNGFSLLASGGYSHARYTELDPRVVGITLDSKLPKTPEWKVNVGPQYLVGLPNGAGLQFNLDYTHTASLFNDAENTALLARPSTDLVNASVTYRAKGGNWELVAGGTNLSDERYLVTGQNQSAGGQIYGTWSRPREWYATARVKF